MNRKPFRKKDIIIINKGLVVGTDGDEGYRLSVDGKPTSSVEQRNEYKAAKEAFANFDRHSIASK